MIIPYLGAGASIANTAKVTPIMTCDRFIEDLMYLSTHETVDSSDHLGGIMIGLGINLMDSTKKDVRGFKYEIVSNNQRSDVIRHIYTNAGGVLSHSLMGLGVYSFMQLLDHYDYYFKKNKDPREAAAEMMGNKIGKHVGKLIKHYFYLIRSTNEEERLSNRQTLRLKLQNLLCE